MDIDLSLESASTAEAEGGSVKTNVGNGMEREDLLSLYDWAPGMCFRHPLRGEIDTARIETLHPRSAPALEIRACRDCILDLECDRSLAARRAGLSYIPGQLGEVWS